MNVIHTVYNKQTCPIWIGSLYALCTDLMKLEKGFIFHKPIKQKI